jgi:hypothetical protein
MSDFFVGAIRWHWSYGPVIVTNIKYLLLSPPPDTRFYTVPLYVGAECPLQDDWGKGVRYKDPTNLTLTGLSAYLPVTLWKSSDADALLVKTKEDLLKQLNLQRENQLRLWESSKASALLLRTSSEAIKFAEGNKEDPSRWWAFLHKKEVTSKIDGYIREVDDQPMDCLKLELLARNLLKLDANDDIPNLKDGERLLIKHTKNETALPSKLSEWSRISVMLARPSPEIVHAKLRAYISAL